MNTLDWIHEHSKVARHGAQAIEEALGHEGDLRSAAQGILTQIGDLEGFLREEDHVFLAVLREHLGDLRENHLAADQQLRRTLDAHLGNLDDCLRQGKDCRPALEPLVGDLKAWARYEDEELVPYAKHALGDVLLRESDARLHGRGTYEHVPDLSGLDES